MNYTAWGSPVIDTKLLGEHFNEIVSDEKKRLVFDNPFSYRLSPPMTERESVLIQAAYLAAHDALVCANDETAEVSAR